MSDNGYILAIEISNPGSAGHGAGSVAIGRLIGASVTHIDAEPVGAGGRGSGGFGGHDDDLMPAIERLCTRAGSHPRSGHLRRVGVSIGPGGYTSTRVACAAGKMIAEASGAECVAVPTALAVLEAAQSTLRSGRVAVALAGKGETAWVQVFENGEPRAPGTVVDSLAAAPMFTSGVRVLIAGRHLPAPIRAAAESAGVRLVEPAFDAAACARVAARTTPIDPAELVPLYPREPDAVTLWRARKKG